MNNRSFNTRVSLIFITLYAAGFALMPLFGRHFTWQPLILCTLAAAAFFLFLRGMKPAYFIGVQSFTLLAELLGAGYGLYYAIPVYDLVLHFASGVLLVMLGEYALTLLNKGSDSGLPDRVVCAFSFLFSVASACVWELWEYAGDTLFSLNAQGGSLEDTMSDVLAGFIGAIIGCLWLSGYRRRHRHSHQ